MTPLKQRVVALLTAAMTALALTACSHGSSPSASGSIDVLSWWTSASESSAFDTLIDQYKKRNDDASVDEIAVTGGGGSQAHVTLASRLARGDAPDVWQSLVGGNIAAWRSAGAVGDISSLFSDDVKAQLPENILSSVSVDGAQYAAPLAAHRANLLMFNSNVLRSAGIAEPDSGYTLNQFLADLDALQAQGTTPLCIGGADTITTAGLFESVLLATIGQDGWEKIEADRFDWNGQEVKDALDTFGRLMDRTSADDASRTWDEAAGRLAAGDCGFYQMNDSALSESAASNGSATGNAPVWQLTHTEAQAIIARARSEFPQDRLFGIENGDKLKSVVATIYQSFAGEDLYPTTEQKAANLLYLMVKDHPLVDGNKRSAAALFIEFLAQNNLLFSADGTPLVSNNALAAMTLMVAMSSPKEKDLMVALVQRLISPVAH